MVKELWKKQDSLAKELSSEGVLQAKITAMLPYLQDIIDDKTSSTRQKTFHSVRRWELGGVTMDPAKKCFTEPFNDQHITIVYKMLINSLKMKTADKNDYIFKVLIPEVIVKLNMEKFLLGKLEAEEMLSQTPVRDEEFATVRRQPFNFTFAGGVSGRLQSLQKFLKTPEYIHIFSVGHLGKITCILPVSFGNFARFFVTLSISSGVHHT